MYGVAQNFEWLVADAYDVLEMATKSLNSLTTESLIDIIVLAPPWGGPDYSLTKNYDLRADVTSGDGIELVAKAAKICRNIIYILPKNIQQLQIQEICKLNNLPCFIETIYLHNVPKMKVIYFGELFNPKKNLKRKLETCNSEDERDSSTISNALLPNESETEIIA